MQKYRCSADHNQSIGVWIVWISFFLIKSPSSVSFSQIILKLQLEGIGKEKKWWETFIRDDLKGFQKREELEKFGEEMDKSLGKRSWIIGVKNIVYFLP